MTPSTPHRSTLEKLRLPLLWLRYLLLVYGRYTFGATRRYRNILKIIRNQRCRTIMEVGVFRGDRALQMIRTATLCYPENQISYYGFDLFEDLTPADLEREFSKRPPTCEEVKKKLATTGARIELFKGYSYITLPQFVQEREDNAQRVDLIFLDGGHSLQTVASDWTHIQGLVRRGTNILLDDYYPEDRPELRDVGCKRLVDGLALSRFSIEILEPEDRFAKDWGDLVIRIAKVTRR